jgi:hypothetical protein
MRISNELRRTFYEMEKLCEMVDILGEIVAFDGRLEARLAL